MPSHVRPLGGVILCLLTSTLLVACDEESSTGAMDGSVASGMDARAAGDGAAVSGDAYLIPNPDAYFWAETPPSMCLADGGRIDPPATAPVECPADRRREGCRCDTIGEVGACWPGPRRNRERGSCRDGMATCVEIDEFGGEWGPCVGAVLPAAGATRGAAACECFSAGRWEIDNLNPCFVNNGQAAVSTFINESGVAQCPTQIQLPPQPEPGTSWSTDRLTVDCAGRFELCYAIRAGNFEAPSDQDCVIAESCVETWYPEANTRLELPALPAWTSSDTTCIQSFIANGGYGEMSVLGLSIECDEIQAEDGGRLVFNRVRYCPSMCNSNPGAPGCENCQMGGSGNF